MTVLQFEAVAITVAMLGLFIWDRWRYDLVACLALLAAMAFGVVPFKHAFDGFANPVVIIIGSVLIVSRAIARSHILDDSVRRLMRHATTPSLQIGLLSTCVAFLSAVIKNVGTLGIFLPIAIQTARKSGMSPSSYLMPLSFASLIGGTMTLIGTSPNILVSGIREQATGAPYQMFDFLPVGLPLTLASLVFLTFGWRLLPRDRVGKPTDDEKFNVGRFTTELVLPEESQSIGRTVGDIENAEEGDLIITRVVRGANTHHIPSRNWRLMQGDILVVQASPEVVKSIVAKQGLQLAGKRVLTDEELGEDDMTTIECVVQPDSILVGESAESIRLRGRYEINLL
ncbi:MAG: SLC13 family permease, partial [Hyphomicrobiales bacterium]|nr:SLC13 family permease [Hyphomicrobiales bacterium]